MTKTSKLLLGVTGAMAAGVVLGLLLAPGKGSDTRKKIKNKAGKVMDTVTGLLHKRRGNHANHQEDEDVYSSQRTPAANI